MHTLQIPGCAPWPLAQGYGHGERIFDIAFHPFNENIVLTASEDTSVRMWRRPDGSTTYKQARAFLGHTGEALRTCWSANGLLLASGSADRTVRLWATDLDDPGYTGRQLAVLDGHPEEVYYVEFVDPAAPPSTGNVRQGLGDYKFGDCGGGSGGGPPPLLPPFESHVLVASSESLFVWSLREGAVVQQADAPGTSGSTVTQDAIMSGARPAYIFGVARQSGGCLLATACSDGVVRLWSLRPTGHLEWVGQVALPGQPMCTGCAFAADGVRLGVTTREGQLVELDLRTMELITSRQLHSSPLTIAFLPASTGTASTAVTAVDGAHVDANTSSVQQQSQSPGQLAAHHHPQQHPELWLVACRDGALYGYGLEQRGGGSACVVRPPSGQEAPLLAVAVAPRGNAVAVGGEPLDTSLLPAMRQQPRVAEIAAPSEPPGPQPASLRPTGIGPQPTLPAASASATTTAIAVATSPIDRRAAAPASGPTAPAATGAVGGDNQTGAQGRAAATAAVVTAPPRRRGARGTRAGPAAAAAGSGAGSDPLELLTAAVEGGAEVVAFTAKQPQRGDALSGQMAAMDLGGTGGQHQLLPRQQDQQADSHMGDAAAASQQPGRQQAGIQQRPDGPGALSGRLRAPLFVYLRAPG